MYIIISKNTKKRLSSNIFETRELAESWLSRIGPVLAENYSVISIHSNPKVRKILNEGLVRNDLEGILLPLISIDEYVAQDPDSNNVVLALFLKNVPEAVNPLSNFLSYCNQILLVDSGDSDTMPNTSIVYAELDREKLSLKDINAIVHDVGMLANLKPHEFSVSFPSMSKKMPYSIELLKQYFKHRTEKMNQEAQEEALRQRVADLQQELKDKLGGSQNGSTEEDKAEEKKPKPNDKNSEEQQPKNPEQKDGTKRDLENTIGESILRESLVEKIVGLW